MFLRIIIFTTLGFYKTFKVNKYPYSIFYLTILIIEITKTKNVMVPENKGSFTYSGKVKHDGRTLYSTT